MTGNESIDWQRIVEIPTGLRHFIIILMSTVITFVVWYWVIFPLSDIEKQRQHELVIAKQSTEAYQQRLADYSTIDALQYRLHLLNSTLQQYENVVDPINLITDLLAQSGSRLIDIKKLPSISENGFTVFRWNVKSQADYFQFMSFIYLINASSHLITIERLAIAGDSLLALEATIHLHQVDTGVL